MSRYLTIFKRNPIIGILILGTIIRLIFFLDYLSDPEWHQLIADSLFHDRWASSIASGDIIGKDVFFRAPFYIYLLGLVYTIFGYSLIAARIFGHLIGLISISITYCLAYKIFSKKTAIIAGVIHGLYPIAIYFESELLVDSLFTMLFELSVLLFLFAREKRRYRYYSLTGLSIGLAAITKPIILAMVPLFIIWIFIDRTSFKKSAINILIILTTILLSIAPVTLRHLVIADDFVLISSSGGVNFFIGNNPQADGMTATLPPPLRNNWEIQDTYHVAETECGQELKASEVSSFWYKKAMSWIVDNKVDFILLFIKKIYVWTKNVEISNNRNLTLFFDKLLILKLNPLNFGFIFSLAVIAMIFLIGQKGGSRDRIFLILLTACYIIVISLFFVNARFRLPAIPFIIILSGYGIEKIIELIIYRKHHLIYIPAILCGIGAAILSYSSPAGFQAKDVASGFFNKANFYLYHNDYAKAINYYHRVLAGNPGYPDANLNLGAVYLKMGLGDSAELYFKKESDIFPDNAKAFGNLASLYNLRNHYIQSQAFADSAIRLKPYFDDPYLISLRNYYELGDTTAFIGTLRQAEDNLTNMIRINLDAGLIFSQWKMYNRALRRLLMTLESQKQPMETNGGAFSYSFIDQSSISIIKARAAYQAGYIHGIMGEPEQSITLSNLAISLDSNLVEAYANLANGYMLVGEMNRAEEILNRARLRFPENNIIETLYQRFR